MLFPGTHIFSLSFPYFHGKSSSNATKIVQLSILIFWVWPLKPQYYALAKKFPYFQSSFSEYDLWNCWPHDYRCWSSHLSILIFWVWPLKRRIHMIAALSAVTFNPHFLSVTFETMVPGQTRSDVCKSFNPHFLSMAFETSRTPRRLSLCIFLSILIFWVWPLKLQPVTAGERCSNLSILIFWVWPLKPGKCTSLTWSIHAFNPHFLSMTFETKLYATTVDEIKNFQSSFSEYDLWNAIISRSVIDMTQAFNPHFLSMAFETTIKRQKRQVHDYFQSSFSEYGLWN